MDAYIRARRDEDMARCVEALRQCHEVDRYPMRWPEDPSAWLRPEGFLAAWIAAVDQHVVGHIVLTGEHETMAAVHRLFVTPAAQRLGLAVALLDAATARASADGRALELDVVEDSRAAIALYERLGWRVVARHPAPFAWPDGTRPIERRYLAPHR